MHIIIVGCGKVGRTLAEQLQEEETDLTLIDMDADVINDLTEDIDAMGIVGNGASINTLMEAGVQTADILIAVTASDELNLLCCLIAQKTGHCQTIARVRNPIYSKEIGFIKERLGLSMIMNPELAAAREISRLLRFPAAIKIDPFSKGRVELLKFKVDWMACLFLRSQTSTAATFFLPQLRARIPWRSQVVIILFIMEILFLLSPHLRIPLLSSRRSVSRPIRSEIH